MNTIPQQQVYRRFSLAERDRRWAEVRRLMQRDDLAAIVAPHNPGNSTDWQADARYLSHCGGGADASIACVFPLDGDVTVVATSANERWGPAIQDWVSDVREANRRYGRVMGERLRELGIDNEKVGVSGLGGGTRTPEGAIMHGTLPGLARGVSAGDVRRRFRSACKKRASSRATRRSPCCNARSSWSSAPSKRRRSRPARRSGLRRVGRDDARDVRARLGALGALQLGRRRAPGTHVDATDRPAARRRRRHRRRDRVLGNRLSRAADSPARRATTAIRSSARCRRCTPSSTPGCSSSSGPEYRSPN